MTSHLSCTLHPTPLWLSLDCICRTRVVATPRATLICIIIILRSFSRVVHRTKIVCTCVAWCASVRAVRARFTPRTKCKLATLALRWHCARTINNNFSFTGEKGSPSAAQCQAPLNEFLPTRAPRALSVYEDVEYPWAASPDSRLCADFRHRRRTWTKMLSSLFFK